MNDQAVYNVIGHCWVHAIWAIIQLLQATCAYETQRLWELGIIDLGWWCWSAGAACRIWSRWSGIVTWSWSVFACVFHHAPITWEIWNYWVEDLTWPRATFIFHPWQSFPMTFLHFLVWMEESVAAGVWPDNIILNSLSYQCCISASMPQKEEIGHFQSTPPLWVSRLQVITVNCWICWRGEHYNHVSPDKAVLKQTKSHPLPPSPHRPRSLIELISMQMLCF